LADCLADGVAKLVLLADFPPPWSAELTLNSINSMPAPMPAHATTATTTPATSRMRTTVDIFFMTLSALEISAR